MTITINANDIQDARDQLGAQEPASAIRIKWRRSDNYYVNDRNPKVGCIVDAVGQDSEEVQRKFDTAGAAIRYIAALLKKHDAWARESKRKHDQEVRKKAKAEKAVKAK